MKCILIAAYMQVSEGSADNTKHTYTLIEYFMYADVTNRRSNYIYIYIYIYMCVGVCVCECSFVMCRIAVQCYTYKLQYTVLYITH